MESRVSEHYRITKLCHASRNLLPFDCHGYVHMFFVLFRYILIFCYLVADVSLVNKLVIIKSKLGSNFPRSL